MTTSKTQQEFNTESCKRLTKDRIQDNNRLPMVTDSETAEAASHHDQLSTKSYNSPDCSNENLNIGLKSDTKFDINDITDKESEIINNRNLHYEDHHHGWHRKTRFHVALLGLAIAVVNCYAQATFCIAIVEMVLPSDFVLIKGQSSHSVMRVLHNKDGNLDTGSSDTNNVADNSCPVEYQYRDYYDSWRFPATNNHSTVNQSNGNIIDISNRFDWDASRQGLLLGAFAVGTAPLQVLGGRLAEIYGAKWVLFIGCIGTALTNLTIPFLAHFSFILLIMNRVVMGIAQAGMEPGLMCLLAEWLTPTETGFFISMLLFAICIGFFLGSLCSSFLLTLGYGWQITYYVAGGINLLLAIVWIYYASSRPKESRLITADELEFIEHEQGVAREQQEQWKLNISTVSQAAEFPLEEGKVYDTTTTNNSTRDNSTSQQKSLCNLLSPLSEPTKATTPMKPTTGQAPWLNILTTRSVWAFIICKISIRWCADVLAIELPTYLANVLHLSIKLNGIVNSVSSALFAIFSFFTGYFVNKILQDQRQQQQQQIHCPGDGVINKRGPGISKTNLRKLMQSFASFGAAISLFLMTRYDCNILFSMSMLLVLSCCLVMGTGGELQIPYDMTSRYPGTLHGMACTLSVSGWLAPPLIGLILGDQPSSRYRWSIVWYMTALINLIGGLVFVLFADASPRDFDQARRTVIKRPITTNLMGHTGIASKGYYNVACKSADSSPPREPRQPHKPTCGSATNESGGWQSNDPSAGWSSHFDSQPIKVRQVEESFIRPYYLKALDSVAASVVIFPYRTKQLEQLDEQHKGNLHQQGAVWNKSENQGVPLAEGGDGRLLEEAPGKGTSFRSLWPRIMRRRRKFCVETSKGGASKLIGSAVSLRQKPIHEPEAQNQMASVEIMIPADVLPHCRKQKQQLQLRGRPAGDERIERGQLVFSSSAAVSMTTKTITHL